MQSHTAAVDQLHGLDAITVLMIEDDPDDVYLTQEALRANRLRINLRVAHDGVEALRLLRRENGEANGRRPNLILLDLKLPGMQGLQLLKWIRTRRDLRLIPVVVLTGSEDDTDVKNAYDAGANSYLRKGATPHDFDRVAKVLQQYWLEHNVPPPLVMRANSE